jgi:hypothetical protein
MGRESERRILRDTLQVQRAIETRLRGAFPSNKITLRIPSQTKEKQWDSQSHSQ